MKGAKGVSACGARRLRRMRCSSEKALKGAKWTSWRRGGTPALVVIRLASGRRGGLNEPRPLSCCGPVEVASLNVLHRYSEPM